MGAAEEEKGVYSEELVQPPILGREEGVSELLFGPEILILKVRTRIYFYQSLVSRRELEIRNDF